MAPGRTARMVLIRQRRTELKNIKIRLKFEGISAQNRDATPEFFYWASPVIQTCALTGTGPDIFTGIASWISAW